MMWNVWFLFRKTDIENIFLKTYNIIFVFFIFFKTKNLESNLFFIFFLFLKQKIVFKICNKTLIYNEFPISCYDEENLAIA